MKVDLPGELKSFDELTPGQLFIASVKSGEIAMKVVGSDGGEAVLIFNSDDGSFPTVSTAVFSNKPTLLLSGAVLRPAIVPQAIRDGSPQKPGEIAVAGGRSMIRCPRPMGGYSLINLTTGELSVINQGDRVLTISHWSIMLPGDAGSFQSIFDFPGSQ